MSERSDASDPWTSLETALIACRRCPRLVGWREQVAREKRRAYQGCVDDGGCEDPALAEERQEQDDRDHDQERKLALAGIAHPSAPFFEACAAAATASSSGAAPYEPPMMELKAAAM